MPASSVFRSAKFSHVAKDSHPIEL